MPPKDITISISFSITHKPNNFCDSVTSNSFSFFFPKDWSQKEFLLGLSLVGGYLCAQPRLPVLSLSIVIVLLFNIYV